MAGSREIKLISEYTENVMEGLSCTGINLCSEYTENVTERDEAGFLGSNVAALLLTEESGHNTKQICH